MAFGGANEAPLITALSSLDNINGTKSVDEEDAPLTSITLPYVRLSRNLTLSELLEPLACPFPSDKQLPNAFRGIGFSIKISAAPESSWSNLVDPGPGKPSPGIGACCTTRIPGDIGRSRHPCSQARGVPYHHLLFDSGITSRTRGVRLLSAVGWRLQH